MQRLLELKHIGLQWAEHAKKALSARSMLYCICLKPLDQRTMIACDQCGEWYHRHCIKLPSPVKIYICAACCPQTEQLVNDDRSTSTKFVEPETPLPQETKSKKVLRGESSPAWKMLTITSPSSIFRNGIDSLWWRNRKPFRRATKKHADFDHLSPFCYLQQQSGQ
ncbi:nucleosome-remodeling factor subunit BPTF-like isoform X2 [Carica papaya]|uniref:nucleosome-remodeling factor subunit BPTF-like isoform X2 n=1 Tax=Carica papaya TaxID=3649 RepID=UPI000B8CE3D3|nr:nucleosome-remodeling factor subunit BPTF-like isoform X2 [Carica papaya]